MSDQRAPTWRTAFVGDLIDNHFCGPSPDCEERPIFSEDEWGVLKTTAITFMGWNEDANKVLPRAYWNRPDIEVHAGDVLVTKAGPRHRVAVVCHVPATRDHLIVSGKMIALRPRAGCIEPQILAGLIASRSSQKYIHDRTTGMAESQVNFANSVLLKTPLVVPPLREQRVISAAMMEIDTLINQSHIMYSKLNAIRLGMLQDLFTRGVDEHGEIRQLRSEAPHLYQKSAVGWIPKTWGCAPLKHLASKIVDGVHHTPRYVESGIPFVTIKNLTEKKGISFRDVNYITKNDHSSFVKRADPKPGDVLVTKDGTLGIARVVDETHPEFSIFVSVAQIRPIPGTLSPAFLASFFDTNYYRTQMGSLSGGSGLKHIHLEQFREFMLPIPPSTEQHIINERIDAINMRITITETKLNQLYSLKSGLMDDLLTGRVRVTPLLGAVE